MTDDLEDLPPQAQKFAIRGLVLGLVAFGVIGSTGVLRIDKFGESDAQILERRTDDKIKVSNDALKIEMMSYIKRQVEYSEYKIRKDMPPDPVRQRIRALERSAEIVDPDYKQPTFNWQ